MMKLLDPEKSGFARYCPTFARAFGCLAEGIRERRQRSEILELVRQKRLEDAAKAIPDSAGCRLLGQLVNHRDYNVATGACWIIRKAAENGTDVLPAMPFLLKALHDRRYFYTRINAAMALKEISRTSDPATRLEIAAYIDKYASSGLAGSIDLDPGATPMLIASLNGALDEIARQDGLTHIARARLWRISLSMRSEDLPAAHANH